MPGLSAEANEPILIAFSGGGDSRALLQRALETASGRPVIAAVVDHGIRAGSAAEAEQAAVCARTAGAEAQVLTLNWPRDPKPSQAAARAGRLYALTAFVRQKGGRAIHLAHTMDDQAETVLMRLVQGSGWRGLAGMAADAPAPLWPNGRGLRFRRPMLRARRAEIRDALRARGVDWIEDPSNEAERYARVRARRRLGAWAGSELDVARWASLASRIAPLAAALDRGARALIDAAAEFDEGTVILALAPYRAGPAEIRAQALAAILVAVAGSSGTADWDQLDRLDAAFMDLSARGGTLGGARYAVRGDDAHFTRDPGAVLGRPGLPPAAPDPLKMGETVVWDGRVAITASELGWEAVAGVEAWAPILRRPSTKGLLTLNEAISQGIVSAEWLLRERIAHLLWR